MDTVLLVAYALIGIIVGRRTAWHVYEEMEEEEGVDWDALGAGLVWGFFAGLWWPITVTYWIVKAGAVRRGELALRVLTAIPAAEVDERRQERLEAAEREKRAEQRLRERRIAELERKTGM
jgi:hypothetical protein